MTSGIEYGAFDKGHGLNYWRVDRTIQRVAERVYPGDEFAWAEPKLRGFGAIVGEIVAPNADLIDTHGPELHTYDATGDVVNEVRYHPKQHENERYVYEAGIVADCFHAPPDRDRPLSFVHNLAMQYLLSYADPGFDCPIAMTTGVALVLERFGDESLDTYLDGLTSRTYADVIEGAMFLTERQGGSDVGATETIAVRDGDRWRLTGEKWFCSNIDAEGTLALARVEDAPSGTEGLSMFLVPHTTAEGELNDQLYRRLKDKLGTISVPTGEVELHGAEAYLVGDRDRGFKQMAEMLNLERLSNAAASCGIMGRALLESKIHAANREAFGKTLDEHPLMQADLVEMTIDHEAATTFTFEAARAFAARERARRCGESDSETDFRLMRVLIPVAKARTARMAVDTASYAMEILGGNGYVRDFITHRLLRDAQVLPIWEGTTNILSLDVLRAFERERSHEVLLSSIDHRLDRVDHAHLEVEVETIRSHRDTLAADIETIATDPSLAEWSAKSVLSTIFDVVTASLLLKDAQRGLDAGDARSAAVATRFIDRYLTNSTKAIRAPIEESQFDAIVRYARLDPAVLY